MQTYSRSSMQATSDQADATSSSTLTLHVDVHCIDDQQLRCPMCARHFRQPVRLDCGHSFCRACIDRWLRRCNACSICRQPTLQPRRNEDLEKIMAKVKPGSQASTRSAGGLHALLERAQHRLQRVLHSLAAPRTAPAPTVEVRQLQREVLRASMRQPKRVDVQRMLQQRAQAQQEEEARRQRRLLDWNTSSASLGALSLNAARADKTPFERATLLRRSLKKLKSRMM